MLPPQFGGCLGSYARMFSGCPGLDRCSGTGFRANQNRSREPAGRNRALYPSGTCCHGRYRILLTAPQAVRIYPRRSSGCDGLCHRPCQRRQSSHYIRRSRLSRLPGQRPARRRNRCGRGPAIIWQQGRSGHGNASWQVGRSNASGDSTRPGNFDNRTGSGCQGKVIAGGSLRARPLTPR